VPLPNWRNAAEYDFPPGFPHIRWAWEFLRRNPEYRKDWATALARFRESPDDFGYDPAAPESANPEHPNFCLLMDEKDKWHLGHMVNPAVAYPDWLSFTLQFGYLYTFHIGGPVEPKGARYPWAFFNLNLPLKPQLETVGRMLASAQKRQGIKPRRPKHHRQLWPFYLRLLDAEIDGRTPKQIADALENEIDGLDEKKVWDSLKAARRMTEQEGYLSIFLSTENSVAG
jgi:Family of unknown function (DUF6499)